MYLEILGREAGSSSPSLSSAQGTSSPVKFPPFPPAVNPSGITGVSTGEER
jgi:hypothetical protein